MKSSSSLVEHLAHHRHKHITHQQPRMTGQDRCPRKLTQLVVAVDQPSLPSRKSRSSLMEHTSSEAGQHQHPRARTPGSLRPAFHGGTGQHGRGHAADRAVAQSQRIRCHGFMSGLGQTSSIFNTAQVISAPAHSDKGAKPSRTRQIRAIFFRPASSIFRVLQHIAQESRHILSRLLPTRFPLEGDGSGFQLVGRGGPPALGRSETSHTIATDPLLGARRRSKVSWVRQISALLLRPPHSPGGGWRTRAAGWPGQDRWTWWSAAHVGARDQRAPGHL